jgi:hypothetical protein
LKSGLLHKLDACYEHSKLLLKFIITFIILFLFLLHIFHIIKGGKKIVVYMLFSLIIKSH